MTAPKVSAFLRAHQPGEIFHIYAVDVEMAPMEFDALVRGWLAVGVEGFALHEVHVLDSRLVEYCQLRRDD